MANIILSYSLPPCCSLLLEFIEIKINTNSIFKKTKSYIKLHQKHLSLFYLCEFPQIIAHNL